MRFLTFLGFCAIICTPGKLLAEPSSYELEAKALEELICRRFCTFIKEADRKVELEAAEAHFLKLLQENPSDAGLCVVYARFSWKFGEQARAFPAYRKAVQLDPANVPAMQGLAECFFRDGRLREALEILRKAAAVDPANAQIQADLGWVYVAISNDVPVNGSEPVKRDDVVATGLRYLRTAVELEPRNASYAQGFGEAIYALQRPDWALAMTVWQRVRALSPDQDMANYHLVRAALRLGRKEAADTLLQQIPLPRRDQLSRYLLDEAVKAGVSVGESTGPTVVTNSGPTKTSGKTGNQE